MPVVVIQWRRARQIGIGRVLISFERIAFVASDTKDARESRHRLVSRYGHTAVEDADVLVALGGDGFMLQALKSNCTLGRPIYGMNQGTVGFLMNDYSEIDLPCRLSEAEEEVINPLAMSALDICGENHSELAINEVSLIRAGPQAASLQISVDGKVRLEELVCDGAMVATPAGSTAYNYSAHGPILPIGSGVLALTPMAAFRPRRWRGALLPTTARVTFDVLDPKKRPVMADADGRSARDIVKVDICSNSSVSYRLLFDHGHGLEERLLREQFT